jgi:DNA polymerase-3 subunit alpha/error-prone DNA polymerase
LKPDLPTRIREAIGRLATSIVGFPHHTAVHCGGIVISDRPITYYTPLELAPKGIQVTQFEMRSIEKIGLIKIDLLGNRALTVIEETRREIGRRRHAELRIVPDDSETARILRTGRTLSCFQLESPAMRNLLAMLKASNRDEATLALALIRPGPSAGGMKQEFIHRRTGGRRVGLPVYEEDAMRIISRFTGTSLAEADIFRRELKEARLSREALKAKFMFLAETAGIEEGVAQQAWDHISRFAAYTFCKAHAASYGVLAYASAYLKANFPLEFYAAALRNHAGMYPLWAHVNEARRLGIDILLPDVNRSQNDFVIQEGRIRIGLNMVKHLACTTASRIIGERDRRPFTSLTDLLGRVPIGREEVASLISSGAFDAIEPQRCRALAAYMSLRGRVPVSEQPDLGLAGGGLRLPTREFSELGKRKMEYASLGFSPLAHPLEFFVYDGAGQRGSAVGLLAAMRHYKSNGTDLYFMTLDHPAGLRECVLPSRLRPARFEIGCAYAVRGRTRTRFGVDTLRATAVKNLPEKAPDVRFCLT